MASERLPRWIEKRGGIFYFHRRVPNRFLRLVDAPVVYVSLATRDLAKAVIGRDRVNDETEAYWRSLARGDDPKARDRYEAAVERAKMEGFAYQPIDRLKDEAIESLLDRLAAIEASIAGKAPAGTEARLAVAAIMGGEPEPVVRLSTLLETYENLTRDARLNKTPGQLHKWRLPHLRAVRSIINVVGDKPISLFTRSDALAYRAWWTDRVAEEGLAPASANKAMTHISKMIATVSDRLELDLTRSFRALQLGSQENSRPHFTTPYIRDVILAPGALAGLNADARAVILVMIELGARPIELVHLRPEDIRLDDAIPHISIEPYSGYSLKTLYSRRQLPLVGVALEGARILRDGKGRYRDKTGSLSASVGKYLAENKMLESEDHSLYSFRHSFADRLTSVSTPDKIDTALMGHKFDRPKYGGVPALSLKLEWIMKIAISHDLALSR